MPKQFIYTNPAVKFHNTYTIIENTILSPAHHLGKLS